jgi:curved DNA-binding protein CbpA
MPPPQSIPDCYERLGLHPDATLEQVKKAYHQLALLRHPDVVLASQRTAGAPLFLLSAQHKANLSCVDGRTNI